MQRIGADKNHGWRIRENPLCPRYPRTKYLEYKIAQASKASFYV